MSTMIRSCESNSLELGYAQISEPGHLPRAYAIWKDRMIAQHNIGNLNDVFASTNAAATKYFL